MIELPVEQHFGNVRLLVEYWAENDLVGGSHGKVTKSVMVPSIGKEYFVIDSGYFGKYKSRALRAGQDCYVGRIRKDGNSELLGKPSTELQTRNHEE